MNISSINFSQSALSLFRIATIAGIWCFIAGPLIMPGIANAPSYNSNPMWYWASTAMGTMLYLISIGFATLLKRK